MPPVQEPLLAEVRFSEKRHGYDPDEVNLFLSKVGEAVTALHTRIVEVGSVDDITLGHADDDFAAELMTVRFSEAKRGYDPDEVDSFLAVVAGKVGEIQTRLRRPEERDGRGPLAPTLFRIALPVTDIDRAARFYEQVFGLPGRRVSAGRHYFDCGGIILACFDASASLAEGGQRDHAEHVCFSLRELEVAYERVKDAGPSWIEPAISVRSSGERSFYAKDPFGNPLCFVDEQTVVMSSDLAG
jgi:DivIVA domain-containing protein